MTLIRKMAGALSLSAIAALMLATVFAATANAQPANPMQVFGVTGNGDVVEGSVIEAMINGESVGTATATADGWVIDIQNGTNGDEVSFTIDGESAAETVSYEGFASTEVSLTAGGAGAGGGETPAPAETGNAGLLGSTGTSMALVLALGVFAAAMVAGGRTATRRS
ncbi:MAG: hypothetical protein KC461_07080 [Dehalococcoidia bacterium]|nr:hypothetical protein [Dehalococcoidia bacterium]MCA9850390.1 hypothetical protein [Dehalococcoidia bacterium]MCB9484368.1 hypothetical protein [Dehalococcoidia bacterium]MCB9490925.1 hypothetical protein [Dehalococcoidia bacterium]